MFGFEIENHITHVVPQPYYARGVPTFFCPLFFWSPGTTPSGGAPLWFQARPSLPSLCSPRPRGRGNVLLSTTRPASSLIQGHDPGVLFSGPGLPPAVSGASGGAGVCCGYAGVQWWHFLRPRQGGGVPAQQLARGQLVAAFPPPAVSQGRPSWTTRTSG